MICNLGLMGQIVAVLLITHGYRDPLQFFLSLILLSSIFVL